MNYDKGFEQGQLVDQHYNPPTGDEPDEYIEGWVDGRMEAIRIEDPETADRFEQIFLGSEEFGKATYRDMLAFLTSEQPGYPDYEHGFIGITFDCRRDAEELARAIRG